MEIGTRHETAGASSLLQGDQDRQAFTTADEETPLTEQERRTLQVELMKTETQALYSDNGNRVTQRNYLLLGIFIVSSALLPLAVQNGVVHRQVALFYNIVVFFLMLLWGGNTDKMGDQNGEILLNEQEARYHGVQTRRAARRKAKRTLPLPKRVAALVGMPTITLPRVLATRWGKQYWGTVGLVLSTDLLTLYLAGIGWDPLSIAALAFTVAVPVFIRHDRPVEEES